MAARVFRITDSKIGGPSRSGRMSPRDDPTETLCKQAGFLRRERKIMKGKPKGGGPIDDAANHDRANTRPRDDMMNQLPADAREAIASIRQHSPRIVESLKRDDKLHELFIRDPIRALHEM